MPGLNRLSKAIMFASALLMSNILFAATPDVNSDDVVSDVYDETAYTAYVEDAMNKLDKLYLDFLDARGVDAVGARVARGDFLRTVHELMKYMNAKYDNLELKEGAALSPTETLISVHAMTMLVDILASTELEQMAAHPHIE